MPTVQDTEPGWYCFQALPKKEHLAAISLQRELAMTSFCPRIRYEKNTRRGRVHFVECLFPGYVFVNTDLRVHYRQIRAIRGIRDLVAFGERVPRIPDSFIESIQSGLDEQDLREVPSPVLSPGREVIIVEGPFKDLGAVIAGHLDARQRVAVLLEFLGRQMQVHLPASSLLVEESHPRQRAFDAPR